MHHLIEGTDLGLKEAEEISQMPELDGQRIGLVQLEPFSKLQGVHGVGTMIDDQLRLPAV
jgi:hypothetical protein